MKEALYYKKLNGEVQCKLCPRNCVIKNGKRGDCRVRENQDGKLISLVYGKPCSVGVDAIEKKPLFHFLPGEKVYSIGTAGCNLHCKACFVAETPISTQKGVFNFNEIYDIGFNEIQDGGTAIRNLNNPKTITHKGKYSEALHIFKHKYDGDIMSITPYYTPTIKCTPNHEFFVCKNIKNNKFEKIIAGNLKIGDYLVIPKIKKWKVIKELDVKKILNRYTNVKIKRANLRLNLKTLKKVLRLTKKGFYSKQIGKKLGFHPAYIRTIRGRAKKNNIDFSLYKNNCLVEKDEFIKFIKENGEGIPRKIKIDNKFGRFLGYFCAEGYILRYKKRPNSYSVEFSFGRHEKELVKETCELIKTIFNLTPKIRKARTSLKIIIGKSSLALLLKDLCGSGAKNKKVPWVISHSNKNVIFSFLDAFNKGDGWNKEGDHPISMDTVSEKLALGIYDLFLKLGFLPSFFKYHYKPKCQIEGRTVNQLPLYYVKMYSEKFRNQFRDKNYNKEHSKKSLMAIKFKENKDYFFVPIHKIAKERYKGSVYNLEVEKDHSYSAGFVSVGNCQNWTIAQVGPEEVSSVDMSPEDIIEEALKHKCVGIAYTYSDPIIFYEYVLDCAKLAKEKGLKNILVSNGFINKEPLERWCKYIDAANIDLKGINNKFYRKYTLGWVEPVLESLKILKRNKVWVEVTNLIIPGANDGRKEIEELCKWISKNLGKETPLHFSRFFPCYKLKHLKETPIKTLEMAKKIGTGYLDYVYIGNLGDYENTYCRECKSLLVERKGYEVLQNKIKKGRCECGKEIEGVWE